MASPSPRHLLRQAISAARQGDRSRARMFLAKVTELDPEDSLGWLWRAGLAEEPEQALIWLHRALELDPEHPQAVRARPLVTMQAAMAVSWAGDFSMARHLFEQATTLDRRNVAPWLHLAGLARTPEEAAHCLQEVLSREPDHEGARKCLDQLETQRAFQQTSIPTPLSVEIAPPVPHDPAPLPPPGNGVVIDELLMPDLRMGENSFDDKPDDAPKRAEPAPSSDFVSSLSRPASEAPPQTAEDDRLIPVNFDAPDDEPRRGATKSPARHGAVLVVDDNPDVRDFVHRHLESFGLAVHSAENADTAIALLRERSCPDLILLDGDMPGVDGFELCNLLRQNAATAHVPIVLLARKDGWLPRIKSMMSGFTDTLAKPISPLTLRELVSKYCPLSIADEGSSSSWPELPDEVLK